MERSCNGLMGWLGVEQGLKAGEDGSKGQASGGNIEPVGSVTYEAAPVRQPAEAALHHPAACQHHEALLARIALDDVMAHAMQVGPLTTAVGDEGAVEHGLAQARPHGLALVQRRQRVAFLHRGTNDGDGEPMAFGIDQGDALAPGQLLASVISPWSTHRDALDRLRVDDAEPGRTVASRRTAAQYGDIAEHASEQPALLPAAEPAIYRAPPWHAGWQRPPGATHPQMPRDRPHYGQERRRHPAVRRIGPLQAVRYLLLGAARHHLLQAVDPLRGSTMARPMLLGPHQSFPRPPKRGLIRPDQRIIWGSRS